MAKRSRILLMLQSALLAATLLLVSCAGEQAAPEPVQEQAPAESILHQPAAEPAPADADDELLRKRKSGDSDDMDRMD